MAFYSIERDGKLPGVFDNRRYPIIWISTTKQIYTLPWEDFNCKFTMAFQENPPANPINLQIKEIRDLQTGLGLFPPYITEEEMPEAHKRIWEKWKQD